MMKEQFTRADKSGKGLAGPAANSELVLYEFLNVITRGACGRTLSPGYGPIVFQEFLLLLDLSALIDRRAHRKPRPLIFHGSDIFATFSSRSLVLAAQP